MRNRSLLAALALAVAFLGIGCSRVASDSQIATNIKSRMFSDSQLKASSLKVTVKNGVATLSGGVPSVAARYEAFKLATETTGVKKVNDQMTVQPSGATARNSQAAAKPPPPTPRPKPKPRNVGPRRVIRQAQPAANQVASSQTPTAGPIPALEPQPAAPPAAPLASEAAATLAAPVQPAPPPAERITVPKGTVVSVRMIDSVDSSINQTGDILHASLANSISVDNKLVAPRGTNVYLRLVEVRSAGHLSGQSELRLELYRIQLQGKSYVLVSNDYEVKGASRTKRSALTILGGAAIGAAIGAIAGGGKGAAIGAATGGGGGAVYQGVTKGQQITIPSESFLNFKLEQPTSVTLNSGTSQPNPDSSQPSLKH